MNNQLTNNEDIKSKILEEARGIFARYGYNKTTVDDIARAAGKGKSTFYYYFKSKEEIFKAVIEKEANLFRAKLIEVISINATPIEKIKNYTLVRLQSFNELVNFYSAIRNEGMLAISFIDEIREKYDQEQFNIIKMVLIESIQNKQLKVDDIDLVTDAMAVILKGVEYHIMFNPDGIINIKSKIDAVINLIFNGVPG